MVNVKAMRTHSSKSAALLSCMLLLGLAPHLVHGKERTVEAVLAEFRARHAERTGGQTTTGASPEESASDAASPESTAAPSEDEGQPRALSLTSCIELALRQNPSLQATRQGISIARGKLRQARAQRRPQVRLTAVHTEQTIPDTSITRAGNAFSGFSPPDRSDAQRLLLTQPLFTWGRLENGVRSARASVDAAEHDVTKAQLDLIFQVKQAFYDLLLAAELIAVEEETVAQVSRQLEQARLNYEAGTVPWLDVLRAEVELANVKPSLIEARYNEQIARETLANLLGLGRDEDIQVKGDFLRKNGLPEEEALLASAHTNRPDLLALSRRRDAARSRLEAAKVGRLPTLSLQAARDRSKGQRFPFGETVEQDSLQIQLDFPFFDSGQTRGAVEEARGTLQQIEGQMRSLEQAIDLEVTTALARLAQSREVLNATEKAVEQAREALKIAEVGYQEGTRTYVEQLDAQLALSVAHTNRARARRDYSVAVAQVDRVTAR